VLKVWESDEVVDEIAADSPASVPFAQVWRQASKVVFSTTLTSVDTRNTELRRRFDPEDVERLQRESTGDLTVEGPTLAAHAWRTGLVDEVHLLLVPTIVGGGLRALPEGVRRDLELLGEQRFANGMVQLRYAVR
jgi:riboflavin biosynthesis pyrimidine reductase